MSKPKIRFKGYEEDWEQRKLGDQMYIKSRIGWQRLTQDEYQTEGDYYLITGTDINEVTHSIDLTRAYYVSKERYEKDSNIQIIEGDIIVTKDGTIGKVAMVCGLDKPATLNSHLFVLRDLSGKLNNRYLLHVLDSPIFKSFVEKTKTGSTLTGLPQKTMVEFRFKVSSMKEQERISHFLDNLDSLITLHQRKCEETKKLKKYMLQKMFPQNGKRVPEIRFAGFTDDWEQRKLDDVLKRRIEQRQQSEEYPRLAFASGQGVIPLSERKTNNREQLTKDEYTKKYLVTELNDIVYNPANVKYGAIDRNKCGRGLISPIYVTFTTNEVPGFIERIVTSHDFQQRALRFEEGTVTKRQSVNPEDLVTLDILVAPKREEQQKIATYFDSLDHLITLHQRKCEELQKIKKFMLQNMFV